MTVLNCDMQRASHPPATSLCEYIELRQALILGAQPTGS